jgi:membrane protease YdiL (CAAX protease family)
VNRQTLSKPRKGAFGTALAAPASEAHFGTELGLFFGWLRTRSNSLYPAVLAHAGWNALVLCEELYP